jgi:capsular polysaccharide biosynthesis protein
MSPTAPEQHQTTAATPSSLAAAPQPIADDTIDLRVYVAVLMRWWKEIVLIGLLFGVVAGGGYWLLDLSRENFYESSADVAILRTVSEVTLDERFITTAETPAAAAAATRRNALIALAKSPAIALDVIEELGDQLPEELRNPATLITRINVAMATVNGRSGDSDLIRIFATTRYPDLSAAIATSWAQAYVRNVNQIYGQVPDELFASIAVEQETSRVNYEAAQRALEEHIAQSRVDELTRAISDQESFINTLRGARSSLLSQLVSSAVAARGSVATAIGDAQAQNLSAPIVAEQEGKRNLVESYVDTVYQGQASIIQQQGERDRKLLQAYYSRWVQITSALGEAQALREQTGALVDSESAGSGSSALVLSLLKLQAFSNALDTAATQDMALDTPSTISLNTAAAEQQSAAAPGLVQSSQPVQVQVGATPLQIQLAANTEMTNAEIVGELDALIAALSERRETLQGEIDRLSAAILTGESIQVNSTSPVDSALAQSIPLLVESILSSSIITSTSSALEAASAWEIGDLAALYNTADLQALAIASDDDDALSETLSAGESTLRALKADLEAERTTQTELTLARDLAQDAYRAANSKKTELTLARAGAGSELRFAAPAIPPAFPVSGTSPVLVAAAATFAGFVMGIVYAFVADAMGQPPFLSRRRSPRKSNLAPA